MTRFYLPASGTAPVSPGFGSPWNVTTSATRGPAPTSKSGTSFSGAVNFSETSATRINRLARQWVSDRFGAGDISGTFSVVVLCLESSTNANLSLQCVIRVVSEDGATVRGTLYAGHALTTEVATAGAIGQEMGTGALTRIFNAVAVTPVTAQNGDRIVIEIGYRAHNTSASSYVGSFQWGDPTGTADYALTASLSTNLVPWVELSATLPAYDDGPADPPPPLFPLADWLWDPIPPSPVLDPQSAAMVTLLAEASPKKRILNVSAFGTTLIGPEGVTSSTPRVNPTFSQVPAWGPDPFGSSDMPWPTGTKIPPGSDAHVSAADPTTNKVYSLWQASSAGAAAAWGSMVAYDGDGRESANPADGSSTGARLSRYAGVIKASEIEAGLIPHALFFSTDMAALEANFRYPAPRSDGANGAGVATPIPEGARVQLDPSINLAAISGITEIELTIGTALQVYGAYCGDNGGERMAFICEYLGTTIPENQVYFDAGIDGDYWDMIHIPWSSLRVLAQWDGSGSGPEPGRMLLAAS